MKAEDLFGLVVRMVGTVMVVYALVETGTAALNGWEFKSRLDNIVPQAVVGALLFAFAGQLVRLTYRSK